MKLAITFLLVHFTILGLIAQTECTVKVVYGINNTVTPSYTFKIDPQAVGAKYYWSFGDNGISDSPAPSHTYKIGDTYSVQVRVTGADGKICYGGVKTRFEAGTVTATTTILSGKGKVKKVTSTEGCGLLITLDNGTVIVPVEMVPAFEFKDGQYIELAYELLKDKPSGCPAGVAAKIHKIAEIIVPTVCNVPITFVRNTGSPISYTFKTTQQPEGSTYYWYFGDGSTSTSTVSPTYSFKTSNTYVIKLKVVDKASKVCYGEIKGTFDGLANPSYSGRGKVKKLTLTGCDLAIGLDNGTTVIPYKMTTDFLLKEGQYVEFTYEKYPEKVSTCKEGSDVKILTIKEIPIVPECKAYFTGTNKLWSDPSMIKKVAFTNLSVGEIQELTWNFGDNTTSKELKPIHEYKEFGAYKVCLSILTKAGCKSEYCAEIKVENIIATSACNFDLVVKPKEATPNTFLFYAVSAVEIKTWKWSFGDGKTDVTKNPEHAYASTGTYEVSCVVTTAAGCTATRTIKHTVLAAPLANCNGAISIVLYDPTENKCNGRAIVKLMNEKGIEITSNVKYVWPDGKIGSAVDNLCPDKSYTVQAIIEGVCQKSYSFTILSKPMWKAATINGQNTFTVISPVEGVQYEWNFGNGIYLKGADVTYNFDKDGVYDVNLKAVNGSDFSEYSQQVVVMKSITGTKIINKSEVIIYPNPVKEMLKINFSNSIEGELLIEITSIDGQKVYSQQLNSDGVSQASVNIKQLKTGIYFLKISTGKLVIADRKFIKAD